MRIIFIRHGDPDYSIDSLTEKGWREAELLAQRVSNWQVTDFYCSTMGRAKDTASLTLKKTGRTAQEYDWLREFRVPIQDPRTGEERIPWDLFPSDWTMDPAMVDPARWYDTPLMQTGEVHKQYKKVCENLDQLLERYGYERYHNYYRVRRHSEDTIVCFCHLGVTCVMLSHLLHISPIQLWHGLYIPPTSVTILNTEERFEDQAFFRCQVIGDTTHLHDGGEPISNSGSFTAVMQEKSSSNNKKS